ncbi:hypothetical protein U1Q18_010126, partial [Sarracenia purpurea var. burkii]
MKAMIWICVSKLWFIDLDLIFLFEDKGDDLDLCSDIVFLFEDKSDDLDLCFKALEAPEEQQKTSNDDNEEDQPPVSKLLISTQNPHDSSPKVKLRKRPYASKEGIVLIKRKRSGSKFETNRVRAMTSSLVHRFGSMIVYC